MSTGQRIFISYRRSDCQSQANGLNDGLRNRLPDAQVFMDLDSIPPGADFEEHIRQEIDQCDVVLVLIGDEWLAPVPGTTIRRIDQPNDFVRLEVMSALGAPGTRVIPVLVEGAAMPAASELPEDIARLARLNAYVLSDTHWGRDITELTTHLKGAIAATPVNPMSSAAPAGQPPTSPQQPTVTFADIDGHAVRYAVDSLPSQFATKDVSTHPAMLATHEDVASRGNYHTMVGRYLMQHRNDLGLGSPGAATGDRGSIWTKVGAASSAHVGQERSSAPPPPAPSWPPRQQAEGSSQPAPSWPPQQQAAQSVPTPRHAAPPPYTPRAANVQSAATDPDGARQRQPVVGLILIGLSFISVGLLSFVAPLWAAGRVKHNPSRRTTLFVVAGVLAACLVVGIVAADTLGGFLLLANWVAGVIVAVKYRNPARA